MPETKICTKCKRELPADSCHFATTKKAKSGLRSSCKECEGYKFTKPKIIATNKENKVCSKCNIELPRTVEYFHRWKHSKDGFRSVCKECRGGDYGISQPNKIYAKKEGYLYCSKCMNLLPLSKDYFKLNKTVTAGYDSICKVCSGVTKGYGVHHVFVDKLAQDGFKYCSRCLRELPATTDYYYTDKRTNSGFSSHCKECKGQSFGETKFNPHVTEIAKEGYYICRCCKEELPLNGDNFNQLVTSQTGYNCYCKKCAKEKEKRAINNNIAKYRATSVIKSQRRRNAKKKLPSTLTDKQWEVAKIFFNNRCAYCGKPKSLAQEHFIPIDSGGEYSHNNIIPSCQSCNSSKATKSFFTWYPAFRFYSKQREAKILSYLGYKNGIQQLSLL